MSERATFDEKNHCDHDGWATYHDHPMRRWRLRCAFDRHLLPAPPVMRDGHSPSNFSRCARCHGFLLWFVDGQHRHGSINRYFSMLRP